MSKYRNPFKAIQTLSIIPVLDMCSDKLCILLTKKGLDQVSRDAK